MTTTIVDQYCKIVRQLVNYYEKNSDHSDRIKHARQVRLIINETPIYVIESTGPELYNRKNHIIAGDMQGMIDSENELPDDNETISIITAILNLWCSTTEEKRKEITMAFNNLLNLYTRYLIEQ